MKIILKQDAKNINHKEKDWCLSPMKFKTSIHLKDSIIKEKKEKPPNRRYLQHITDKGLISRECKEPLQTIFFKKERDHQ